MQLSFLLATACKKSCDFSPDVTLCVWVCVCAASRDLIPRLSTCNGVRVRVRVRVGYVHLGISANTQRCIQGGEEKSIFMY